MAEENPRGSILHPLTPFSVSTTHPIFTHDETQVASDPAKPTTVPGRPTSVSVEVYDAQSLKVVFSPPADDGGDTGNGRNGSGDTHAKACGQ